MVTKDQAMAIALISLTVAAIVVAASVFFVLRVRGAGTIKTVGLKAYSDPELTKEVSAIDWGIISPGGYSQTTLYLKITSNVPSNLTLHTENWDPAAAETYLTLTWNYDGSTLNPGQVIAVLFTLSASEDVVGITDFSFDIVITAAG